MPNVRAVTIPTDKATVQTFLSGFSSLTQEKADAVYDCYRQVPVS